MKDIWLAVIVTVPDEVLAGDVADDALDLLWDEYSQRYENVTVGVMMRADGEEGQPC